MILNRILFLDLYLFKSGFFGFETVFSANMITFFLVEIYFDTDPDSISGSVFYLDPDSVSGSEFLFWE